MTRVTPLKIHGGKHYLASRIIERMPPHLHYVEPYFGGGAVLFAKDPEGVSEVVNDIAGELTNFWLTLQSAAAHRELRRRLAHTPCSEWEWRRAREAPPVTGRADVVRAWRFFIRYRQSRQGLGRDFATVTRARVRRGRNEQVSAWQSACDSLPAAHERLARVLILNRDGLDVIRQNDGPDTLFYLDPPYLLSTRSGPAYDFEFSEEQHTALLAALVGLRGRFLLSGYRSPLYDAWARDHKFPRDDFPIDNKASGRAVKPRMVECVWRNFP